ncbi:CLUMA_CG013905, isoform A [Clunio marinus]|uniref:CLUMA_CG013905, isoform A n=1 Tax=Clunio marinus TaxID=568069 RepID=A0A1J1IK76_9DIPT|nr:CLUMA_CG013905, isoform A [Clunio marinus]
MVDLVNLRNQGALGMEKYGKLKTSLEIFLILDSLKHPQQLILKPHTIDYLFTRNNRDVN